MEMQVEMSNAIAHFKVMMVMRQSMVGTWRMSVHTLSSKTETWYRVSSEGN